MYPATDATRRLGQIRRLSRLLVMSCTLLMIGLPLALLLYWGNADHRDLVLRAGLPITAANGALTATQRVCGALLSMLPLGLLLVGLSHARHCFKGFACGRIFTAESVVLLRRFAGWVSLSVLASIVVGGLFSVLLTMNNPPGMRHIAIAVGSANLFTWLFAAMIWLMAAIIGEGQHLADENASFV